MDHSDELEQISFEAEKFYDEIRGIVVVFLFFALFFTVAHLVLQYFLAKSEYECKFARSDRLVYQLVLGICTFTLAIAFASFSLLPFSIAANEILLIFPKSHYIQWLNTELIQDLAFVVSLGTKISCLVIPFSYFLLLSQGFHGSSPHSLSGRLLEALVSLIFSYILSFGTVWSFSTFVSALYNSLFCHINSTTFEIQLHLNHPITYVENSLQSFYWPDIFFRICLPCLTNALESIQLIISVIGLFVLLICTSMGLIGIGLNLVSSFMNSLQHIITKSAPGDSNIDQLNFEALTIVDNMQSLLIHHHAYGLGQYFFNTFPSTGVDYCINAQFILHYQTELSRIRCELVQAKQSVPIGYVANLRERLQPIFYIVCFVFVMLLLKLMESFAVTNIVGLLWNLFWGNCGRKLDLGIELLESKFTLGSKPASSLGHIGAVFQIFMIHFLLLISLRGFYSIPSTRFLRPRHHSTNLDTTLVNILLLLILSTALPLQTNYLGLTTFILPNPMKLHYIPQPSSSHTKCSNTTCDKTTINSIVESDRKCHNVSTCQATHNSQSSSSTTTTTTTTTTSSSSISVGSSSLSPFTSSFTLSNFWTTFPSISIVKPIQHLIWFVQLLWIS